MAETGEMTGAQALLATLAAAGVDVCFTNPGTSEMHFVQALDSVPQMRGVLAVFEGVATGAADGYARIAGHPAAVLLHLGPGLGNGLANLHNARRANTPVVCLVGAHATDHVRYDAPLQSDIEAAARTVSGWVHTSGTVRGVAGDVARAVAASFAGGGQVATLVVPADLSWETGAQPAAPLPVPDLPPAAGQTLDEVAALLSGGDPPVLFLGGRALTERGLRAASRISTATGARLLVETFPARIEGGGGLPRVQRLAYFPDQADKQLAGVRQLVLVGARSPVAFFGYPGRRGDLVPEDCVVTALADRGQDAEAALEELAGRVAAGTEPVATGPATEPAAAVSVAAVPVAEASAVLADEPLTALNLAGVLAASLPDRAIVVDEGNTSSLGLPTALAGAARHSLLTLTGGAIGQGLPVATGAAVAAPDRPVVALEADGSALYTIQALWTMARERLNVTTVLINNAAYAVLRVELARTGAGQAGPAAARLLDLSDPVTDFTAVSTGLGVPATRVTTTAGLDQALRRAYAEPGPHLIEAIVPPVA